jgi:cation diffusion facilitator CzcD-associated flavoprotein CzcO
VKDGRLGSRGARSVEATEVAVIAAGPAGLAVAARLQRRQIDFIILEKEHQVGSSWRKRYDWRRLHTIKSRSSRPFRSFDGNCPRYVRKSFVVRYLVDYATFNVAPYFGEKSLL